MFIIPKFLGVGLFRKGPHLPRLSDLNALNPNKSRASFALAAPAGYGKVRYIIAIAALKTPGRTIVNRYAPFYRRPTPGAIGQDDQEYSGPISWSAVLAPRLCYLRITLPARIGVGRYVAVLATFPVWAFLVFYPTKHICLCSSSGYDGIIIKYF